MLKNSSSGRFETRGSAALLTVRKSFAFSQAEVLHRTLICINAA